MIVTKVFPASEPTPEQRAAYRVLALTEQELLGLADYPPRCPKCGGNSISSQRAGMSATPYKCTTCSHPFDLLLG